MSGIFGRVLCIIRIGEPLKNVRDLDDIALRIFLHLAYFLTKTYSNNGLCCVIGEWYYKNIDLWAKPLEALIEENDLDYVDIDEIWLPVLYDSGFKVRMRPLYDELEVELLEEDYKKIFSIVDKLLRVMEEENNGTFRLIPIFKIDLRIVPGASFFRSIESIGKNYIESFLRFVEWAIIRYNIWNIKTNIGGSDFSLKKYVLEPFEEKASITMFASAFVNKIKRRIISGECRIISLLLSGEIIGSEANIYAQILGNRILVVSSLRDRVIEIVEKWKKIIEETI
ncbi:MAG: hypothetical protein Q6363_001040 [Candidatus Njordarchaeota archaeon]